MSTLELDGYCIPIPCFRTGENPIAQKAGLIPRQCTPAEVRQNIDKVNFPLAEVPDEVIASGAYSLAMRVNQPGQTRDRKVVIVRHLGTPEGAKKVIEAWQSGREEVSRLGLSKYVLPEEMVVTSGKNGDLVGLRFTPEVPGATLFDLKAGYLLGIPEAMGQLSEILSEAYRMYRTTGKLLDLGGHVNRWLGLVPLITKNIMWDMDKAKMVMVDTEQLPSLTKINRTGRKKLMLEAKAQIVRATGGVLKVGASILDRVRGINIEDSESECRKFEENILGVIDKLNESGIDYRIVGGLAVAAWLKNSGGRGRYSPHRRDGSVRDVDILIMEEPDSELRQKVQELREYFLQKKKEDRNFPPVDVTIPAQVGQGGNLTTKTKLGKLLFSRHICDSSGTRFGNEVDTHVVWMNEEEAKGETVAYADRIFKTFKPEMLMGFALCRNGAYKFKDIDKYRELANGFGVGLPEKYRDFATYMRAKHRTEYQTFLACSWLSEIKAVSYQVRKSIGL